MEEGGEEEGDGCGEEIVEGHGLGGIGDWN